MENVGGRFFIKRAPEGRVLKTEVKCERVERVGARADGVKVIKSYSKLSGFQPHY